MNKLLLALVVFLAVSRGSGDQPKPLPANGNQVIHVATALEHLTVLEFGEPVVMAAVGSADFQIERHQDKVFVKPLKQGVSTDLFVWTASRRFTYELEASGEIKDMNVVLDHRIAAETASKAPPSLEDVADTVLTRALLGAERIDSSYIKDAKDQPTLRVEQVFRTRNTLYIQYSLRNTTLRPYQVRDPAIYQLDALRPSVSPISFHNVQLSEAAARKFGLLQVRRRIQVVKSQAEKETLNPGETTQGVIAVREQLASPAILQLLFGELGNGVRAIAVF
jgi:hypothetical protein